MSKQYSFSAVIEDPGEGGAYVSVPFDVEAIFGKKRVKIKATIDGQPYRGTLVRMGPEAHILIVLKSIRQAIGKTHGDTVDVVLEEDTELRVVKTPQDFQAVMERNPAAAENFARLSYTHQKEYVKWIEEAKKEETRQRRINRAIEMLTGGQKTPL